jgi:hypothetical protein
MMDDTLLQIRDYAGEGYQSLVTFGSWRVAILNYMDGIHPDHNDRMERHIETDEVFVLTRGKGVLIMGGNGSQVDGICPQSMDIGVIYNVRRNAWHTILLSRDASVLIVENHDTGVQNSEFAPLSEELKQRLAEIARQEQIE